MPNLEAIGQRTRSFFQSIARRRATSDSECPTPTADSRPQMIRKSTTQDENVYQPVQVGTKVESPEHASGAKRKGVDKVIYQPLNAPPISVKLCGLKVGQEKSDSLGLEQPYMVTGTSPSTPKSEINLRSLGDWVKPSPICHKDSLGHLMNIWFQRGNTPNQTGILWIRTSIPIRILMDVLALRSNKKSEGTINKRPSVIEEVRE